MHLLACLIVAPQRGYDEPAILSYAISSFCPTSADGLHSATLFFGLPDHLANVIPVVGRNALRDGGQRELLVLPPNGIGLRLPLDVLLLCGLRPRVTPLL